MSASAATGAGEAFRRSIVRWLAPLAVDDGLG